VIAAAQVEVTLAEQLGPFLPLIGVVVGGLIVGAFAVYNRRKNNVEVKMPSVAELWAKQVEQGEKLDAETDLRRKSDVKVEELEKRVRVADRRSDAYAAALEGTRDAFKAYVARIQRGGSNTLTKNEKALLDLPVVLDDSQWNTIQPNQQEP